VQEHDAQPQDDARQTGQPEQNQPEQPRTSGLFDQPVQSFDEPPEPDSGEGVSMGRIIRLGLLLALLVGLIVVIISSGSDETAPENAPTADNAPESATGQERNDELTEAGLQLMREALAEGRYRDAADQSGKLLDAMGADPRLGRLLVALNMARFMASYDARPFRTSFDARPLNMALQIHNSLVSDENGRTSEEEWQEVAPLEALERTHGALAEYPNWQEPARDHRLRETDARWLNVRAELWLVARGITAAAPPGPEAVRRIAAWTALHVHPLDEAEVLASPFDLLLQARCERDQAAWAVAELCNQAGMPCRVLEVGNQVLLHVKTGDGADMLINPWMGVPLLELDTGRPLPLAQLRQDASAYNALAAAAGFEQATAEEFRQAELTVPLHPRTFYDRMVAFAEFVEVLPNKPATGLRPEAYPEEQALRIWPGIMEQILPRGRPLWQWRIRRAQEVGVMLDQARRIQLLPTSEPATSAWASTVHMLQSTLAQADVPAGADVLERCVEDARWFAALAAFDTGDLPGARVALESYLGDYAEGRWRTSAELLLAEVHAGAGDAQTAETAWQALPTARRLYGIYRARGWLAPATTSAGAAPDAASN
jgi:hypothetical protein